MNFRKNTNINNTIMSNTEVATNPNSISRIAAGTTIVKGEIHSEYDIRFDGYFDGNIYSKGRVIIGETAVLRGELACDNLDIWGDFEGTVNVKDTICLKGGSSFKGSIRSGKLVVELGSKFDGDSKILNEAEYEKLFAASPNPIKANEPKQAPAFKSEVKPEIK